jgi:hypothetical protein
MSNDTAKTQTINIVPVQGIFQPLPPYAPVTLIGPAGTPFFAPINPNLDGVSITNSTINSSVIGGITPSAGTFTNIATTTGTITAVPSGPTSLVNQAYVDAVAQGLSFKQPAAYTTTGNITLSGLGTQANGDWLSSLTAGERILVRNQTAQEDNGIYVAASSGWTRAADANTYNEYLSAYLFVTSGTIYSGSAWVCTNQPGGTLGVTPIVFIQFSNTALYTAGTGLTLSGFTFSITNTGVVAASYGSASNTLTATVNAQGQLTSLAASPIAILNTQVSGLGTMSTQNANTVAITGGNIDGTTIGGSTAAAITGTTVTANTQFSGPGTGITGTASALSIGGNAATATSATTSNNLAGGTTGSLPYQSSAGATTFLAAGTNGYVLTLAGGVPTWAAAQFQGDVVGPASATDNALARYDGSSGKLIQNSTITLSDAGALQDVNEINFDITPTSVVGGAGSLSWNSDDNTKTLELIGNNNVGIKVGEENYYRIKATATITKGQVLMLTGTVGASGGLTAAPATGLTAATGSYIIGLAKESAVTNDWIYVQEFGEVKGIDTSGSSAGETWVNGDILYYNPAVTGGLTKNVPAAPNAKVQVAAVTYANASNGILFVRPTFEPRLNDLSNVYTPTPSDGDVIVWDNTDSRWENRAQSTLIAGKATNLAGGSAGQVPYQSAADTTGFTSTGTSGQVLTSQGTSAPTWTTITASIAVTDDTTTNATRYPLFADVTSGTLSTTYVSSTKYQFNPSTGVLTATSFSGAGTGLTGTAGSLSIGGNAATATSATSATTATNLAGGATGSLPYQSGAGATTFLSVGTNGQVLTLSSGVPTWATPDAPGITITDDTTTNATRYITFTSATTGTITGEDVSSTKLQFNPSSGVFSTTGINLSGLTASAAVATDASKNLVSVTNTGTGNNVLATSPTLTTPDVGAATATSINKVAITAPATSATLTIANGKTLTANNSLTLAGTDSTTMTFPSTSASIARTDAAQTFTGDQTIAGNVTLNAQADLRFADSDSSNWVALQGPATISSNVTWTLPAADGSNGQVLSTNGSGTLAWSSSSGSSNYNISYLIVGGGGSGGGNSSVNTASGGGGGGGGIAAGIVNVTVGTSYTITIGAGGSGTVGAGNAGNASSFGSEFVVTGGGRGGSYDSKDGGDGGSGGGGSGRSATETNIPGSRSVFAGGYGGAGYSISSGTGVSGGGGGGAGGAGYFGPATASSGVGGQGGRGALSEITGTSTFYGGGGGGGSRTTGGTGGSGGGGAGSSGTGSGTAGTANTGGGGGGSSNSGSTQVGASGGSGVVILRILTTNYSGTTTGSPTVTTDGSYTVVKFTASGSYTG